MTIIVTRQIYSTQLQCTWKDFKPRRGQQDKRSREGALHKVVTFVKKNFNQLGIAYFVSVPLVNNNRRIQSFVHVMEDFEN